MSTSSATTTWNLEYTFHNLPEAFYQSQAPVPVQDPSTILFNETLAKSLDLEFLIGQPQEVAQIFSGNHLPKGAKPLAQAYAGHQFGHPNMLGDGRAVLLGEQRTLNGALYDVQLKGSGQTPFSRRGDGRATLYSMLREYLISEAMQALGIPTTRSLAVVATGEPVYRETPTKGAVLTRVASSHLRVGTFEYARRFAPDQLPILIEYALKRHFPDRVGERVPALALFEGVIDRQIDLIVHWMRVGFIHGVMNTDNMTISGETIDYGPCAFLNQYHEKMVFSSIDHQGRYSFGNQPAIAQWNLSILAGALLEHLAETEEEALAIAKDRLSGFAYTYTERYFVMMSGKLGISDPVPSDHTLIQDLLQLMQTFKADYTNTFLALETGRQPESALFQSDAFKAWTIRYQEARARSKDSKTIRRASNPIRIPRNHLVEEALTKGADGDLSLLNSLLDSLQRPYDPILLNEPWQKAPEGFDQTYQTFCGT